MGFGIAIAVTGGVGQAVAAPGDIPCDAPAQPAVYEEREVLVSPAEDPVYEVLYEWSNPPGQGNTDNPGQGDEQGREERWLPEGEHPNPNAAEQGQWFKTGDTMQGDLITPGKDAVFDTITVRVKDAVPAGDPCEDDDEVIDDDDDVIAGVEKTAQKPKAAAPAPQVLGAEAVAPPMAVDAGLVPVADTTSGVLAQGLLGAGLLFLVLASAMQWGRRGRGAHHA